VLTVSVTTLRTGVLREPAAGSREMGGSTGGGTTTGGRGGGGGDRGRGGGADLGTGVLGAGVLGSTLGTTLLMTLGDGWTREREGLSYVLFTKYLSQIFL